MPALSEVFVGDGQTHSYLYGAPTEGGLYAAEAQGASPFQISHYYASDNVIRPCVQSKVRYNLSSVGTHPLHVDNARILALTTWSSSPLIAYKQGVGRGSCKLLFIDMSSVDPNLKGDLRQYFGYDVTGLVQIAPKLNAVREAKPSEKQGDAKQAAPLVESDYQVVRSTGLRDDKGHEFVDDVTALTHIPYVVSTLGVTPQLISTASGQASTCVGIMCGGRPAIAFCTPFLQTVEDVKSEWADGETYPEFKGWVGKRMRGLVQYDPVSGDLAVGRSLALPEMGVGFADNALLKRVNCFAWDSRLQRLYVGLTVFNASALIVLQPTVDVNKGVRWTLRSCAAFTEVDTADYGFGMRDATISITALAPLHASTGSSYIVCARTTENSSATAVYALPVVGPRARPHGVWDLAYDESHAGLLRKANAGYATVAMSTDDIEEVSSPSILVGGAYAPGPVDSMFTVGDAVCVTCVGDTPYTRGIYKSAPLFTPAGEVYAWTGWEVVCRSEKPLAGGVFFPRTHTYAGLISSTGERDSFDRYFSISWNRKGAVSSLLDVLMGEYFQGKHGIASLLTGGSEIASLQNCTALWGAGFERGAIIRTSSNGVAANSLESADSVLVTHPAGFVADTTITPQGYWCIAGSEGCVVYAERATGVPLAITDETDITLRAADAHFTLLPLERGAVRRIFSDNIYIYCMTRDRLYRCEQRAAYFRFAGAEQPVLEVIADAQVLDPSGETVFFDGAICKGVALLATTSGLYRTARQGALTAVSDLTEWNWEPVTYQLSDGSAHSLGLISQLSVVKPAVVVGAPGANIFALGSENGSGVSILYRLALEDDTSGSALSVVLRTVGGQLHADCGVYGATFDRMYTDGSELIVSTGQSVQEHFAPLSLYRFSNTMTEEQLSGRCVVHARESDVTSMRPGAPVYEEFSGALLIPAGNGALFARH